MYSTLAALVPRDRDFEERTHRLEVLRRFRVGSIYDGLPYEFHVERTGSGEYIPLRDRRPSVRYGLCGIVVRDVSSLLFGERRFPVVESPNDTVQADLAEIVAEMRLNRVMLDVSIRGSAGSVVMLLRVLRGRLFVDVMDTVYLTPEWQANAPDMLAKVVERRKVRGDGLAAQGYAIPTDQMGAMYWFQREWDQEAERWFLPWPVISPTGKPIVPAIDRVRTVQHGLGFVPIVWMTNLAGGDKTDGECTFEAAIHTSVEIDYQLSQAGRGLKYQSDPLLMIREPASSDETQMVRSAANALVVSEGGDAKMLEISGSAAGAVLDYVRTLRELALETVGGNRSSADKIAAAQSGRAMELMHQPLVWVADQLRLSYGDGGMLALMKMICQITQAMPILVQGRTVRGLDPAKLSLRWGPWFAATHNDKLQLAQTLSTSRAGGFISRERAIEVAQEITDAPDPLQELALILADEKAADERVAALPAPQTKVSEQLPN